MHGSYAIQFKCAHRTERFQLAFARAAIEMLPRGEDTAFEASRDGLTMLGETELALEKPLARLRQMYGGEVRVDPPAIRYRYGEQVQEPHMGVRILCSTTHFEAVRRDVLKRGASILDSELTDQFGVLRVAAPLACLIGYPAQVRQLTDERARLTMWLSHYAPVQPPTGGDAA